MIRQNIFAKPYVVTIRKGGETLELVLWGGSAEEIRERVEMEANEGIEVLEVKERG